jgi:AmmeMemoRadiSam system protein A
MSGTDAGCALGTALLQTARQALAQAFDRPAAAAAPHAALAEPGATFVTLTQRGELRGCIGTLEAHRPLGDDVRHNALAAAFRDPRFAPLAAGEYAITRIEVSLLSAPAPLPIAGEDDLLRQLRPGTDGIVLAWRGRRATFLPQVWESLPAPQDFIAALKQKAGLPARFWDDEVRIARYNVDKWKETVPPAGGPER